MASDESRAFWTVSPGVGEIRREALGPLAEGRLRVRTLYTGISRGTESLVFRGEVPASEARRMRAPFQTGDFPGPLKYGYSNVGEVEAGPAQWIGRQVFCLFPHQSRFDVTPDAVTLLPRGLPAGRAVLAANLETAINITWDLVPMIGDRIAVVGAGVVGLLTAWLLSRIPGTDVRMIDIDASRAAVAKTLGLEFVPIGEGEGAGEDAGEDAGASGAERLAAIAGADRVVHVSGHPDGLVTALALAGQEATLVEASWFGSRAVALPLGEAFHAKRLTLRSSQVGHLPAQQLPRWDHSRRLALALDLLKDPVLDALVSGESPLEDLPMLMTQWPPGTLCHRIRY